MWSWIRFGWARQTAALSLRLKLLLPVIGGAVLLIAIIGFIFISTYNDLTGGTVPKSRREWTRYATAFSISYNRPTTSHS
jgi:hypothetical protein